MGLINKGNENREHRQIDLLQIQRVIEQAYQDFNDRKNTINKAMLIQREKMMFFRPRKRH